VPRLQVRSEELAPLDVEGNEHKFGFGIVRRGGGLLRQECGCKANRCAGAGKSTRRSGLEPIQITVRVLSQFDYCAGRVGTAFAVDKIRGARFGEVSPSCRKTGVFHPVGFSTWNRQGFAGGAVNQFSDGNAESRRMRPRKIVLAFVETDLSSDQPSPSRCDSNSPSMCCS
jgi:hypothetical protein